METQIPVVLHAATLSQALPVCAAALRRGRRLSTPARLIVVWCLLLLLDDAISLTIAHVRGRNLWYQYPTFPLESCIALWAFSLWQSNELLRIVYRIVIPVLLLVTAAALLMPGRAAAFDDVVVPLYSLVLLIAAVQTLLYRTFTSEQLVTREDWFWIGLGMSLTYGTAVAIRPFAQAFITSRPDWVADAYIAKAWTDILAFLLITRGILLRPNPLPRSGGRS